MTKAKSLILFLAALLCLVSVICATGYSVVTNEATMKAGFEQYADTAAFGVEKESYGTYANALCAYMRGETEQIRVKSGEGSILAFSDKENAHMRDVRGITYFLSWMRFAGIAAAVLAFFIIYLLTKNDGRAYRTALLLSFSRAAIALLGIILALVIWGLADFNSLFYTFHRVVFTNDLWLLNPATDLLLALMPFEFFVFYAGALLKALAPILLMIFMLAVLYGKFRKELK